MGGAAARRCALQQREVDRSRRRPRSPVIAMPQVDRVRTAFVDHTRGLPDGVWAAPGRVNLIGDHTDYNEGYVLPIAIDRHVVAAVGRREDDLVRAWSLQQPDEMSFALGTIGPGEPGGWAAYVGGVAWALAGA